MKKILLIVLIGFVVVSIFTIMFTIQKSSTFNFTEDNGDNGDDHVAINHLDRIQYDIVDYTFEIFTEDLGELDPKIYELEESYSFLLHVLVFLQLL